MKITALATICLILAVTLQAQTRVISGNLTVFDSYPVQHVKVSSKKAKATTKTDSLGYFTLVCLEKDVIQVSPKAFKKARKKVDADTDHVTINLQFIDSEENRQIAVGYGYISE